MTDPTVSGFKPHHFFRYTFSPIFLSSIPGMLTLPSLEAMMIVFPEEDGPNSLERSTLMVRMVPSTFMSIFFTVTPPLPQADYPFPGTIGNSPPVSGSGPGKAGLRTKRSDRSPDESPAEKEEERSAQTENGFLKPLPEKLSALERHDRKAIAPYEIAQPVESRERYKSSRAELGGLDNQGGADGRPPDDKVRIPGAEQDTRLQGRAGVPGGCRRLPPHALKHGHAHEQQHDPSCQGDDILYAGDLQQVSESVHDGNHQGDFDYPVPQGYQ